MSDYFFYDLNKKMADLANKQQLAEDAQAAPAKPNKLMEAAADYSAKKAAAGKDIGKPGKNFSKIAAGAAKRYGSAEAGKRVAGAVLNKLRHTEESIDQAQLKPWKATMKEGGKPDFLDLDKDGNRKEPMKSAARSAKKDVEEGVMDTLKKGYNKVTNTLGDIGIIPDELLSSPRRDKNGNWNKRTNPARNNFIDWIEENPGLESHMAELLANFDKWVDDGNSDRAAGKNAVEMWKHRMKREKQSVSEPMRRHSMTEVDATPQDVGSYEDEVKAVNAPQRKASAPKPPIAPPKKTVPPKKPAMYPPQAIDEPVKEGGAAPGGPGDYNYIKDNYQNVTLNGRIIGTTADGGKTFISSRPAEFKSGAMPQGATVDSNKQKIEPMRDYGVDEGGVPMSPKQKKFAALAKPFDKITFADKIVGAKKEVDEMLGDVAANAMKKAVRGRNRDMEESWIDDEPTRRRSSSGGEIDTSEPGVTRHRAIKGNYSGASHDASADDEPSGALGRRKVGAGMGKKIGAKINRGTSKLMTREGDMPEDMIEPQDQGEYDQEGQMAKDDIKTVVRHAQALEKILGDNDNLPEWVQAKLAKIEGMMTAVDDYMQNQQDDEMEVDEESTNKRDSRAERAGRKVAKDIEYDEKKKDGIHGKKRGSEDDKAERAGKRVTKDIEYDEKKKDKKKKEVDETTTSGSVATGAAPKSSAGTTFGKGIYDSLNRQLENMISESMNINMSMNNDEHGGPRQSLTVTATDDDAVMLAGLLKMAGMGHGDEHIHAMTGDDSDMDALHNIDHMHGDEPCEECGQSDCECDDMMENIATNPDGTPYVTDIDPDQHDAETARLGRAGNPPSFRTPGTAHSDQGRYNEMDEAYGDTDASENEPDWPTDEEGTDDAMMYSGGLNGPKSTGQTTIPVIAGQDDRMGYNGLDEELGRMLKIAGLR